MYDIVIIFIILILLSYSCIVSYYCYRFAMILIKLEDIIEISLIKLESIKEQFIEILEIPVFFDSIEIRKCINLIKTAKIIIEEIIENISNINPIEEKINLEEKEKIEDERKEENN